MSRYLDTRGKSNVAIAICLRCKRKVANADLCVDPDTQLRVCEECVDLPDPWRLPPRITEDVSLAFVSRDVDLYTLSPEIPGGGGVIIIPGPGTGGPSDPPPQVQLGDFTLEFSGEYFRYSGSGAAVGDFTLEFSSDFAGGSGLDATPPPSESGFSSGFNEGFK